MQTSVTKTYPRYRYPSAIGLLASWKRKRCRQRVHLCLSRTAQTTTRAIAPLAPRKQKKSKTPGYAYTTKAYPHRHKSATGLFVGRAGGEVGDDECTPTRPGLAYHLRQGPISFMKTEEGQDTSVRLHDQCVPAPTHVATDLFVGRTGGEVGDDECTPTRSGLAYHLRKTPLASQERKRGKRPTYAYTTKAYHTIITCRPRVC